MARKRKNSIWRTIVTTVLIIVGIIVCSTSFVVALDFYCRADINHWMPVYPDAELVETQQSGFFRERASGITVQIYYTSDSQATVLDWYADYRRELTTGQYNAANPDAAMRGIATTNRRIVDDPDTGGSFITYYSECAYS